MSESEILQWCILPITLHCINFIVYLLLLAEQYRALGNHIIHNFLRYSCDLRNLILFTFSVWQDHGGELTSKVGGPHTLRLLPIGEKSFSVSSDVFSAQYIYDCVKEKRLLDPSKYRYIFCCFGEVHVDPFLLYSLIYLSIRITVIIFIKVAVIMIMMIQ